MTPTQPTATTTEVTEAMVDAYKAAYDAVWRDFRVHRDPSREATRQGLSAALALSSPPGEGVPGMVLVPREPDANMCMAGYDAAAHQIGVVEVARAYRAMLSASSTGKETP